MSSHLFAVGDGARSITSLSAALLAAAALIAAPTSAAATSGRGRPCAEGAGMGSTPSARVRAVQRRLHHLATRSAPPASMGASALGPPPPSCGCKQTMGWLSTASSATTRAGPCACRPRPPSARRRSPTRCVARRSHPCTTWIDAPSPRTSCTRTHDLHGPSGAWRWPAGNRLRRRAPRRSQRRHGGLGVRHRRPPPGVLGFTALSRGLQSPRTSRLHPRMKPQSRGPSTSPTTRTRAVHGAPAADEALSPSELPGGRSVIGYVTVSANPDRARPSDRRRPSRRPRKSADWNLVEIVADRENGRILERPGLGYASERIAAGDASPSSSATCSG